MLKEVWIPAFRTPFNWFLKLIFCRFFETFFVGVLLTIVWLHWSGVENETPAVSRLKFEPQNPELGNIFVKKL